MLVHWIELNAWFRHGVWVGWSKATLIKYHTTLDSINSLDLYIIITEHFISSSQFSLPIKMSHLSTIQLTQMLFLQKTIAQELNEPCTSLWLRCVPRTSSNGVRYEKKNHSQSCESGNLERKYSNKHTYNFFSSVPALFYSKFPHSQEDKREGITKNIYTCIFSYQTLMV